MKVDADLRKKLHDTALDAPKTSGVYLWKDETGLVLYVGKAKSLKNRLSSYFTSNRDIKTNILISRAHSIEYITTANEYEALLLENTLIKQYSPRYNISLKDGKTYPVIKVTNEDFPRIYRTRRVISDGAHYFGPYSNLHAADNFLDFVKRSYPLRQCKVLHKRQSPCLYFHIGRCSAPCTGAISKKEYQAKLAEVLLLLEGQNEKALKKVTMMMKNAARDLLFEKAARIRDGMSAMSELQTPNAVVDMDSEARDYIAWAAEGTMVTFAVLRMRTGKLTGRDLYRVRSLNDEEEILCEFLLAYYTDAKEVPPKIYVPSENGISLAQKWFTDKLLCTTDLTVLTPDDSVLDKRHRAAMVMAQFNAKEDAQRRLKEQGDFPALEELMKLLSLPTIPSRIEGFDIAHIGGKFPVASCITFLDGVSDKKNYRLFRLKTTDGLIDDFASMREVTARRYSRRINEGLDLPDLILVDGGIGQVHAVEGVLESLGAQIPVVGLAKKEEELYVPGRSKPVSLPKRSDALRLLQRIRDETHRFATTKNQKLRTKEVTSLIFEELPSIGPRKAQQIMKHYLSLESLKDALEAPDGINEVRKLLKISAETAREILLAIPHLKSPNEWSSELSSLELSSELSVQAASPEAKYTKK